MPHKALRIGHWRAAAIVALFLLVGLTAQRAAGEGDPPPDQGLVLEIRLDRNRVYLGETVPITVTLLVGQVSVRNIGYPRLKGDSYSVAEFAPPRTTSLTRGGHAYTVYEFTANLKPRRNGKLRIGPAEVSLDLVEPEAGAAAYFGGGEPRHASVHSAPASLTVLPLPTAGRPDDFAGAVGHFTVTREISPAQIRGGDPITVTTRIKGDASVDGFSCVPLELPGVRSYPPRARRRASTLNCEQVLVPDQATNLLVPSATISFFDPTAGRYRIARSAAVPLKILDGKPERQAVAAASPAAAGGTSQARSADHPYLVLVAVALLSALAGYLLWHRRVRHKARPAVPPRRDDPRLDEVEEALESHDTERFHTAVYRALQNDLGARYGLAPAAITGDIVASTLHPAGVPEQLLRDCAKLFAVCDRARFSPGGEQQASMQEIFSLLKRVVQSQ